MCRFRPLPTVLGVVVFASFIHTAHAAITVTSTQTYQTIEGLGCVPTPPALYQKAGVFFMNRPSSWEFDRMCNDLGITGMRFQLATETSYLARGVYDWTGLSSYLAFLRPCIARGVDRYIITILNPPGWAKSNGNIAQGGNLLDAEYDGFAEYMGAMCKAFKDSTGVEPYALCVQNEPAFPEPYGSCIYSDANFSRLTSLAKAKLTARGLTTRMVGPQDLYSNGGLNWPITRANPDLYAYAGHGNVNWSTAWDYANAGGKKLWMCEWDIGPGMGSNLSGTDPMTPATPIMSALQNNLSWWTWFHYSNNLGSGSHAATDNVDTMWVPDKRYYATKMFSRFIRRGAVRLGCSSTNSSVTAVAFKNPDNSIAIVMINSGSAVTEAIGGAGLPATWHAYQTDASQNCAYLGSSNGQSIPLPANSITSVTSAGPIPSLPADTIPYRVAAATPDNTVGQINAFGDDILQVWVNGTPVSTTGSGSFGANVVKSMVRLNKGDNIVACYVRNVAWGGGLLASMMLPGGDTLHTDATWKVTYTNPTANAAWNSLSYDDSKWNNAKDVGPVTIWPGFANWGSSAVNLYFQNAHWILGGEHTYFRKVITFTNAGSGVYVRGNNFTYKIYVDGNLVKQGTEFANCTGDNRCFMVPTSLAQISLPAGSTHCIGLDITDASSDGNGVLLKAGYTRTGAAAIPMDTTWWCSDSASAGWSTTSFADTANWTHPNVIDAYDAGAGVGKFIYPGEFWFRKKFTSQEGTQVMALVNKLMALDAVVSVRYFTLQGREFKGSLRGLPALRTALIERRTYRSGRIEEVRLAPAGRGVR